MLRSLFRCACSFNDTNGKQNLEISSESYGADRTKDVSVGELLGKSSASVTSFVRFEVGEGIEKKVENFADEVMKQIEDAKNKDDDKN